MTDNEYECCGDDCGEEDCCDGTCCSSSELSCCGDGCLDDACCSRCPCDFDVPAEGLKSLMEVSVPEGRNGPWVIERYTVAAGSVSNWQNKLKGRGTPPGEYTRLLEYENLDNIDTGRFGFNDVCWMSDVDAERRDHLPAVRRIAQPETRSVLIHGLGIGMVVQAATTFDHIERIDVVELDERVIALVGDHYTADSRVRIHQADAFEQAANWPEGTRWDVVWSDIWPSIDDQNAESMRRLRDAYQDWCGWHGFWGADTMRESWGVRI